jgi:protein-L-isoaspartate(D-aspartate) O-methyltransferase
MNTAQARFNMIEQQIRPWNVLDANVLELLATIRREDYVPLVHKALAFADLELPLRGTAEQAAATGQVMLAPRLEARLLQDLAIQPHESVLEIGTGSGFMAALLAHRAQRVLSLEIEPELVSSARANLQKSGVTNVEVRHGDGAKASDVTGQFDVIVLSGSVTQVPQALLQHLNVGGRLAAIVGDEPVMCATIVKRNSASDFTTTTPWDTMAPRLLNFPEPSRFTF